jgi:hypothetical protein
MSEYRKPDLYWVIDDGEAYGTDPNEMMEDDIIEPELGDRIIFSCAVHAPNETWQAVAVDDDGNPCPKCGGLSACADFLGLDCGAERVRMVKLDN